MKKKRKKLKKIVLLFPIILVILGVGIYFLYNYSQDETIKAIRKNYSEFVLTNKDAKLYNKNHKEIGSITKDFYLELEKVTLITQQNKYLKIKDTNIYINYKDIKKTKEISKKEETKNYIPLNKEIEITSEEKLLEDDKEIAKISNTTAPVEYMDNKFYYISLFGKTLKVEKNKNIKEKETKNNKDVKKAEYVSVIYYEKIKEDCSDDNCLKKISVNAHINKLKNEGYYFLSKDDFISYMNGYKNFKENAIFITTDEINDSVKELNETQKIEISKVDEKDGITFETTNKKATPNDDLKKVNRYQAKHYTLIDEYDIMAKGEDYNDSGKQTSANQGVPVVNYHFFINKEKDVICVPHESICLEESLFRSHLDWLKENNYKTLTIHEFADWMDGIIEIPDKSILITVDDGAKGTGAHNGNLLIPVLEEYKMHATLFLIAGWWDISNYQSPYLDIQSHTYDMHNSGTCGDVQLVCANKEQAKEDIKKSLDIIKDNTTFCYPFYKYDNEAIEALKELGVRYAFAGGSRHARRTDNHYIIPRYPIVGDVTKEEFAKMVQ